jgi:hypothetical protein
LTSGLGFGSSINLPITTSTLAATTIYIHIQAGTALGSVSGNVSVSGGGASTVNLAVTGNVISAEPIVQASNIVFSNVADNTFDINWTNGNGASRIVVVHLTSTNAVLPTDGLTYTANTNIFSASTTGSGNYVVYNGTGTGPVTVTNLTAGSNYTVNVYEYPSDQILKDMIDSANECIKFLKKKYKEATGKNLKMKKISLMLSFLEPIIMNIFPSKIYTRHLI